MSQNNDDKPHSYTESAYKEGEKCSTCGKAKEDSPYCSNSFHLSAPSESVEDHAKRFAEWLRKNNWSAIPKSDQHWFNILSGEKLRTTNDLYSDFTRNP